MVISRHPLQLEEHMSHPQHPPTPFDIPPHAPFVLQFVKIRVVEPRLADDPPKQPTATDAHTTGGDGSSPNPGSNEELDWENDD